MGNTYVSVQETRPRLTLVALLLLLDPNGQILALLPVDLVAFSVIIDEVTSIAGLVLVEVGLGDGLVGEKLILLKLENETETGLVEVLHTDVDQVLQGALVTVGDHLSEGDLVLHGGQPELWNTADMFGDLSGLLLLLGLLSLLLLIVVLLIVFFAGKDLLLGGFGLAVDDLGTLLVEWGKLGKVLLLKLENLFLELGLEFGVFFLNAFETSDALLNLGRQGLDVAGGSANERAKTALNHLNKLRVLSKNGGSRSAVQLVEVLCCGGVKSVLLSLRLVDFQADVSGAG